MGKPPSCWHSLSIFQGRADLLNFWAFGAFSPYFLWKTDKKVLNLVNSGGWGWGSNMAVSIFPGLLARVVCNRFGRGGGGGAKIRAKDAKDPAYVPCPSFPCFFLKKARKTTKKKRIFHPCRNPKIPGKEGKNARKNKEFLALEGH